MILLVPATQHSTRSGSQAVWTAKIVSSMMFLGLSRRVRMNHFNFCLAHSVHAVFLSKVEGASQIGRCGSIRELLCVKTLEESQEPFGCCVVHLNQTTVGFFPRLWINTQVRSRLRLVWCGSVWFGMDELGLMWLS